MPWPASPPIRMLTESSFKPLHKSSVNLIDPMEASVLKFRVR
jgi:hypothetical protein